MKVLRFPGPEGMPDPQGIAEIEAALHGDAAGPSAASWRELREDVRSLAPPIPPGLEARLHERLAARTEAPGRSWVAKVRAWPTAVRRHPAFASAAISVLAAVVALVIVAPWDQEQLASRSFGSTVSVKAHAVQAGSLEGSSSAAAASSTGEPAPLSAPAGREQQRAAQLTLAPKPGAVQSVADEAMRLAVRDGGYVQSSQVRLNGASGSAAELRLSLPSAQLSGALSALGRLAPMRSENQSLQDITGEYDATRTRLADAVAERQALLRALARAETPAQVDSLRQRIALASSAVARARKSFQDVAGNARNSVVEVSVIGDSHAGSHALGGAWHDALSVLRVALTVVLIALAVLVPLSLLLLAGAFAWRAARRWLRERALS